MSVNWNWENKVGTLEIADPCGSDKTFVLNLYQGNAMLIAVHEYKNEQGRDMYTLYMFFNDEKHLKNVLGMNKKGGFSANMLKDDGWLKIRINTKKWWPKGCSMKLSKFVGLLLEGLPDLTIELFAE